VWGERIWALVRALLGRIDAGFSASSASDRVRIRGVLGRGNGRVGEVGTVVGWVAGREALVGLLAVVDSRSGLTESGQGHVARGVSMLVTIVAVSECGMFRGWRLARARPPDAESGLGPSPIERSTPSFSFPSVAAIHLTPH